MPHRFDADQLLGMLFRGRDFQHLHMDLRIDLAKCKESLGQQHRNCLVDAAHTDVAQVRLGGVAHIGDRLFDIGKNPFCVLDELRPSLGQADLPGRPEKQSCAKFVFQRRDPFRQSGLAQPQAFACSSEVQFFRDSDEAFQLSDVQSVTLCSFIC